MQSYGLKQAEIAEKIGKTQSYASQQLRLLKMPQSIQEKIISGKLSEGVARQLLRIENILDPYIGKRSPEYVRGLWGELMQNSKHFSGKTFNSWVEYFQDFFAYENKTVEEISNVIDQFEFLIMYAHIFCPYDAWLYQEKPTQFITLEEEKAYFEFLSHPKKEKINDAVADYTFKFVIQHLSSMLHLVKYPREKDKFLERDYTWFQQYISQSNFLPDCFRKGKISLLKEFASLIPTEVSR